MRRNGSRTISAFYGLARHWREVPGADHSMRIAPADLDDETRIREKFARKHDHPFSEYFIHSYVDWMLDQFNYLQGK